METMKNTILSHARGLSALQKRRLALPAMLTVLLLLGGMLLNGLITRVMTTDDLILMFLGVGGSVYIAFLFYVILPNPQYLSATRWWLALLNGLALGVLAVDMPLALRLIIYLFTILSVVITAIIIGRGPAYVLVGSAAFVIVGGTLRHSSGVMDFIFMLSLPLTALIVNETILRLMDSVEDTIARLNVINEFAAQIASSLEPQEVISILSSAIKNTLQADTYFVGLLDADKPGEMTLKLIYDEGEFFPERTIPLEGTLSNWMISNRQALLIPDLRHEPVLEGVAVRTVGTERLSLSWLGVPMITGQVLGVITLASYRPNFFEQSDLELLENLAQQAALALENAYRYQEVQVQSRQDSLTSVYNHGYFLKRLQVEADEAKKNNQPISLIMLDVDLFKQYNDSYGHLVGDEVLIALARTIRGHIKSGDMVGRWGGEEFIIALPGADALAAAQVAERIRITMSEMFIDGREHGQLPAPTVSQGISLFPYEADEIFSLIDLADQRLYVAKGRGRNQIEPDAAHWKRIKYS
jgi:diguanylate cyclase (GGDEF)-like protein